MTPVRVAGRLLLLPLLAVLVLATATAATDLAGEHGSAGELTRPALTLLVLALLGLFGLGLRAHLLLVERDALLEGRVEDHELAGVLGLDLEPAGDPVILGEDALLAGLDLREGVFDDERHAAAHALDGREDLHLLGEVEVVLEASHRTDHRRELERPALEVLARELEQQEVAELGEDLRDEVDRREGREVGDQEVGHEAVVPDDVGGLVVLAGLDEALALLDVALELDLRDEGPRAVVGSGVAGDGSGLGRDLCGHECTSK